MSEEDPTLDQHLPVRGGTTRDRAVSTWAVTSRSIVRRSLAAPSSIFFGCFDRHAPTPAAVGPDGLRIMIGASARQETGFRGHPPGSWRKPRVPSHCYTTTRRNFERQFSPVRRPSGCGSSSVARVAAGLNSPPRQSSGSGAGAVSALQCTNTVEGGLKFRRLLAGHY